MTRGEVTRVGIGFWETLAHQVHGCSPILSPTPTCGAVTLGAARLHKIVEGSLFVSSTSASGNLDVRWIHGGDSSAEGGHDGLDRVDHGLGLLDLDLVPRVRDHEKGAVRGLLGQCPLFL